MDDKTAKNLKSLRKLPRGGEIIHHMYTICTPYIHFKARSNKGF